MFCIYLVHLFASFLFLLHLTQTHHSYQKICFCEVARHDKGRLPGKPVHVNVSTLHLVPVIPKSAFGCSLAAALAKSEMFAHSGGGFLGGFP
jgi:hypothetical protein